MKNILNIGLDRSDGRAVNPDRAIGLIYSLGGARVLQHCLHCSDTEPTLVVETDRRLSPFAIFEIARELGQEAIAQFDGREGELYGPNAAAWLPFDPAFFVKPDGSRLAPTVPLAA